MAVCFGVFPSVHRLCVLFCSVHALAVAFFFSGKLPFEDGVLEVRRLGGSFENRSGPPVLVRDFSMVLQT